VTLVRARLRGAYRENDPCGLPTSSCADGDLIEPPASGIAAHVSSFGRPETCSDGRDHDGGQTIQCDNSIRSPKAEPGLTAGAQRACLRARTPTAASSLPSCSRCLAGPRAPRGIQTPSTNRTTRLPLATRTARCQPYECRLHLVICPHLQSRGRHCRLRSGVPPAVPVQRRLGLSAHRWCRTAQAHDLRAGWRMRVWPVVHPGVPERFRLRRR
jgi:hypothetical protein